MKNTFFFFSFLILQASSCAKIETINYKITETSTRAEDDKTMADFFLEIKDVSESKNCTNAENWRYVEYGSKACGGPIAYMAYSIQINTKDFLNKVEVYTALEKKFNTKWSIISDCGITPSPRSIKCVYNKAELFY